MRIYNLMPNRNGYVRAVVYSKYPDLIIVELQRPKPNFKDIPPGEPRIDIKTLHFHNESDYLALLLDRKGGIVAQKYLKKLGLKALSVVI